MNITKVFMVRSAKGCDMLCVDNYLYHYEDRGTSTYRWVCNKRKDKFLPCRSRIITSLIGNDESKHQIHKVVGEHSHDRCTVVEIKKAIKRKHNADSFGEPCTLEHKSENRKIRRITEYQKSAKRIKLNDDTDDSECDQEDGRECDNDNSNNEKPIQKGEIGNEINPSNERELSFKLGMLYMFKTTYGRQIICLDRFLYRLEAKSATTFRWECLRRRTACTARLYTVRLPNGMQQVRQHGGDDPAQLHTHGPYTREQLNRVLQENNLIVVNVSQRKKASEISKELPVGSKFHVHEELDLNDIIEECPEAEPAVIKYELIEDPLVALKDDSLNKCVRGVKKFTFLPSAKGNKVLCLDNYIYHYDSRSPSNGRCYWTCIMRRDTKFRCNGRITTEGANENLRICKVSGVHRHPNNVQEIKIRLFKNVIKQKASKTDMEPSDILRSSMQELGDDFKRIVPNSKETVERLIKRLRMNIHKSKIKSISEAMIEDQNESSSSISTVVESEDDKFELPSLEQMREKVSPEKIIEFEMKIIPKSEMYLNVEGCETEETDMFEEHVNDSNDYDNDNQDDNEISNVDNDDDCIEWQLPKKTQKFKEKTKIFPAADIRPLFKQGRKGTDTVRNNEPDMDVTKVSTLRSAKGGELLCVDGYIYHMKSVQNHRTYWACIKCKDRVYLCKSRVATVMTEEGIKVFNVTNHHSHPVNEYDIKRRLYNELIKGLPQVTLTPRQVLNKSLDELSQEYAEVVANSKGSIIRHRERANNDETMSSIDESVDNADLEDDSNTTFGPVAETDQEEDEETQITVSKDFEKLRRSYSKKSNMKLYAVSDGPPSLAVRMTLKALNIPYELVNVDYIAAQHMSEEYAKMNPQKEIPVLDDNGFYLSESVAIMQYLCDKYAPNSALYPKDAAQRAIVNHRLCFNMGFYYSSISAYAMAPIFFDYPRNEMGLKKVNNSLSVFETYLQSLGSKYVAADDITIADFALVAATICLEAIGFDLTPYPLVKKWYETFKVEHADLWAIANGGMQEIAEFERNPPDLSHMNHPFHPTRKAKV